jgi:uncharacterized protein (DUF433 family)
MTDHTTPLYTPSEARAILRVLGCTRLPALSTLRKIAKERNEGYWNDSAEMPPMLTLLDVVGVAITRGVTDIRLVPRFGNTLALVIGDGLLSITPGVVRGACCIDGTRVPTWCAWSDTAGFARDYEVTLAQAEAALRWERAARGQA